MERKQDDNYPGPNFYGYFRESVLRAIMPLTIVVKIVANYRISYLITARHGNSLRHKVDWPAKQAGVEIFQQIVKMWRGVLEPVVHLSISLLFVYGPVGCLRAERGGHRVLQNQRWMHKGKILIVVHVCQEFIY